MKIPHNLVNCTHDMHTGEHSIGTRVDFLQLVRLQVTHILPKIKNMVDTTYLTPWCREVIYVYRVNK